MQAVRSQKAISPIIATLLLILIAIAAGVIVYAYVTGFIGNSTSNSGATTNTLSMDNLYVSSQVASATATVSVHNLGPSSEALSTGFFIKGSSLNTQLVPAITVKTAAAQTISSLTEASLTYASATTITVSVTISCSATNTLTITALGQTATSLSGSCPTSAAAITGTITLPTGYVVSSTFSTTVSGISATIPGTAPTTVVVGTAVSAGTISVPINSVLTIPLTESGLQVTGTPNTGQFNNPLTSGQTYTVQVTGTDGATVVGSAKSS